MAEYIRSARVLVEIDTNKQTYRLDLEDVAPNRIERLVREFLEECSQCEITSDGWCASHSTDTGPVYCDGAQ